MIRINRDQTRLKDISSTAEDIALFLKEKHDKRTILVIE